MNTKKLIAVVDDEPDILRLVAIHLKKSGFDVKKMTGGRNLLKFLQKNKPSLIILDLMLPDMDGIEICKIIKKDDRYSTIPVIMLTAKGDESDKILGLELGADDYITKPFSPKELTARVKAVLRRHLVIKNEQKSTESILIGGMLEIDARRCKVFLNGNPLPLTTTEFKILQLLASNKETVFSRDKILNYLWGEEKAVLDRTVDVHIRKLREKLGRAAYLIKNTRNMGYSLEE